MLLQYGFAKKLAEELGKIKKPVLEMPEEFKLGMPMKGLSPEEFTEPWKQLTPEQRKELEKYPKRPMPVVPVKEPETKTVVDEGLAPRTAEAMARPRPVQTGTEIYDVAKAMDERIKMLGFASQAMIHGSYVNPATGERIQMDKAKKQETMKLLTEETSRWSLYYHLMPMATRGLMDYWTPRISKLTTKPVKGISPKAKVVGRKPEFAPTTKTAVKPAPASEVHLQYKFETELMKQKYGADWWSKAVPKTIANEATAKVSKYLKGYAPYGSRISGVTPTSIQTAIAKEPSIIKEITKAGLELDKALKDITSVSVKLTESGAPANLETFTSAMNTILKGVDIYSASTQAGEPTYTRTEPLTMGESAREAVETAGMSSEALTGEKVDYAYSIKDFAERHKIPVVQAEKFMETTGLLPKPIEERIVGRTEAVVPEFAEPTMGLETEFSDPTIYMGKKEDVPDVSTAIQGISNIDETLTLGGQPGQINLSPLVKGYEKVHDFIFAHGEAKRLHPELYKSLMARFHQEGASIEKAVDILNKTTGKTKVAPEDDTAMAFAYEDKRLISTVTNRPVYKKLFKINQMLEKFKLQRGLLKQPVQERMIEENQDAIKILFEQHRDMKPDLRGRPTKEATAIVEQIGILQKEIEQFKNMRYLPQNVAARRAIENKLAALEGKERTVFIERLGRVSSRFVKRTGRVTLKDLVETGLLKPEDVRLTRLTLQNIDDYYRKVAVQELHANAKMNGFIKPFSQRLKEEGWKTPQDVGVVAPELKGQLLHPVYGKALEQIKEMKMRRGSSIRQLFGAVKVSQFIKPSILLFYDGVQAIMRGMYSFNPIHTAKFYNNAINDVLHKSAMYHRLNKLGLYQHPAELPRSAREETANIALNNLDTSKPGWRKWLSRTTGMSWDRGDIRAMDVVLTPIRALAQIAWAGDKTIRTASVYALMDMGYPIEEAVDVAAKGHGGYSLLSPKYRKTMGMLTFVHSFRVLMPIEIAKTAYEPVMGVINAKTKGQNIPPYKKKRWAKAIIGSLIIPAAVETYFRARGFKPDKLGWKWKKVVTDPVSGEEREVVVTVNNIINMPIKWYHRLAYNNPIVGTNLDYFYRKIMWEIHPIYRTGVDIATNRPSMAGELRQVYNPSASVVEKLGQVTVYAMRNMFRHTELIAQAVEGETLTRKEREVEDRIMKEALTWYERLIFGRDSPLGFGYAYARTNKEKVGAYWWRAAISEHKRRLRDLEKYEDSKVKEKVRKSIDKWFEYCKKWLKKEYDFEPFVQEEVEVKPEKQVMKRGYAKQLAEQ